MKLINTYKYQWLVVLFALVLLGCEQDITVELPEPESQIVVDGRLELQQPPIVFLTRNMPYFAPVDIDETDSFFVHDAIVTVSDGDKTVQLQEMSQTDPDGREIYFYTDPGFNIVGQEGETYKLTIEKGKEMLTAQTSLPPKTPLDSLWYKSPKDKSKDSLVVLMAKFDDPDTLGNFLRYFTVRNPNYYNPNTQNCLFYGTENFKPGYVFDDKYYNGKEFQFPLDRGQRIDEPVNPETYGLFWRGDTIIVKWCAIDKPHYKFWQTWEYSVASFDNPFSSPTRIESNINGGLGVWGGYSCSCHAIEVKK